MIFLRQCFGTWIQPKRVVDKTQTPSPWNAPKDYPNGIPLKITISNEYYWKLHCIYLASKIQLVVYHQCCVLIGCATSRLYVIAH